MSNVFIPHDLVVEVLSRLSTKSLLRFQCVSKSWCRIINSHDFIKTHYKLSKSKMEFIGDTMGVPKLYDLVNTSGKISKRESMKEIKYPEIICDCWRRFILAGSCNGLVCLVYSDLTIVLWNPSTQKHLVLPICSKHELSVHGFLYDERTDDYKVVRVERHYDAQAHTNFYKSYIYSLKSNKWKSLEDFAYGGNLKWGNIVSGDVVNGALHWALVSNFILVFNLETESLQVLPPPKSMNHYYSFMYVAILSGCQYLVYEDIDTGKKWIVKDYESKDPWTKISSEFLDDIKLFIMRMFSHGSNIQLYKLERPYPYFESLVRLDVGDEQVEEGRKKKA